ncbi:NADH-quinone oxidoreductase subunit A [Sphingobacterium cellulitidis]|uniref:NADH-quinone oxidoreductase subunit A n=1 Tax=Sphingobacterium cellulitidis TaxID=1768011 RepID=UPI000B941CE1|nr:NADH-quinone oxidoreductase subunit A [Sphingobacterium cellulitidis]OYD47075.1 NADH-quinone oxidoreductase subunit A [Sphingobacterium cellulitidis]
MDDPGQISEYGKILLMAIIGIVLVSATMFLARILSPKNPNPIKLSTYECGEETTGTSWVQFNPRFYVIALVFLLFDVELIFIFPWATVFGNAEINAIDPRWGWFTLIEMAIFLAVLIVGLIYVWRSGDISWIKPKHQKPVVMVGIPASAYDQLNAKEYQIKDFKEQEIEEVLAEKAASPVKLGFKPKFKKPSSES